MKSATGGGRSDLSTERHNILIYVDSRSIICALALHLSFSSAVEAEPSEAMVQVVEDAIRQYGKVSGIVASCDHESALDEIDALSEQVSAWRYPSWWDSLSGAQADYALQLQARAAMAYSHTLMEPCPGRLFIRSYMGLKQQLHDLILTQISKN